MYKFSKYNVVVKEYDDDFLIYNTYTGSVCLLENEYLRFVRNCSEISEKDKNFEELVKQGIIVSSNLNEYNRIISNEKGFYYEKHPAKLTYVIAPTLLCNMKCFYCFESESDKYDGFGEVVRNQILDYIEKQAMDNPNVKNIVICWFGGEPLLKLNEICDFSSKIKLFCKNNNIEYSATIITNGLLLTKENALRLVNECNVSGSQITLDGTVKKYCEAKGVNESCFYKVLNNIKESCDLININIRLNCNKNNVDDLKSLIDSLINDYDLKNKVGFYIAEIKDYSNCNECSSSCFSKNDEFTNVKLKFYKYFKEKYDISYVNKLSNVDYRPGFCNLIKISSLAIGPIGEFYACEHNIGKKDKIIGNVSEGLYYNNDMLKMIQGYHPKKCQFCSLFPVCLTGCVSELEKFGDDVIDCKGQRKMLMSTIEEVAMNKIKNKEYREVK